MNEWRIRCFRQMHWPPFKPWCAIASRKVGNVVYEINEEGDTEQDAIERLKQLLRKRAP